LWAFISHLSEFSPELAEIIENRLIERLQSVIAEFSVKRVSSGEFSPFVMREFTRSACYNAGPRAMGQRAERGINGPKTLPEGEPRSQSRHPSEWALGRQVAGRRDSS
jgi:hypothetical protein